MKFRIGTILWVFALLAAAMSTFVDNGLWFASTVVLFWGLVFRQRYFAAWEWLFLFIVILGTFVLLQPAVTLIPRYSSRRISCMNNMRIVGIAILSLENKHRQLPPAYTENGQGQALHSWRFFLLPYLDEQTLSTRIHQKEPWDSPGNKPFTDRTLNIFCFPKSYPTAKNYTNCFAVVDPRTAWPGNRGLKMAEIKDGPEQTILLIEAGNRNIAWAEPRDLTFNEAVELLTQPPAPTNGDGHWIEGGWFYKPGTCRHVLFADGSVRAFCGPMSRELAVALLTIDGGEEVDMNELDDLSQPPELNYSRIYSLTVFVLLSLMPIRKLKRVETSIAGIAPSSS